MRGLQLGPRAVRRGVKKGMAGASRVVDCLVPRTASAAGGQLPSNPEEVEADEITTLTIALSQASQGRWAGLWAGRRAVGGACSACARAAGSARMP